MGKVLLILAITLGPAAKAEELCNCTESLAAAGEYRYCYEDNSGIGTIKDPAAHRTCKEVMGECGAMLSSLCPGLGVDGTQPAGEPECNSSPENAGLFATCQNGSLGAAVACAGESKPCIPKRASCPISAANDMYTGYCSLFADLPAGDSPAAPTASEAAAEAARRKAAEEAQKKLEEETLAKRKALEEELAKKGDAAIRNQSDALKSADDLSLTGMNNAATIGALWCAHGANAHLSDKDLAEQSYGSCKDYMGAADALRAGRGRNETFSVDENAITGDWASGILGDFEKNFGIGGSDFLSRLLGSSDRAGDLSDMTKGKIKAEELAEAYANGKGNEQFELSLGGKGPQKKSSVRADLKKALADQAKRKLASEKKDAIAAATDKRQEKDAIEGLKAMSGAEAFGLSDTEELTIFQVVHRKYQEIFGERRKL